MGWFFKMLGRGIVLGFALGLKGLGKMFSKIPGLLMLGLNKLGALGKMGLAGLKGLWGKMKSGAMALGMGASMFGKAAMGALANPRMLLTAAVLLVYALYMCFGMKMCQSTYQKPG